MKLSALKKDPGAIEAGNWVSDIPEMGDIRLKVRGLDSRAYADFVSRRYSALPASERERGGVPKPEARDRIIGDALAEIILLDWQNIEGDDGKPLPFSREKATEMMADPSLRAFRDAVVWAAGEVSRMAAQVDEDVRGN